MSVAELMFCDFTTTAMDQIVNEVAKKSYLSGGRESVGLVIRTASGAGISFGPQHSQGLEAWFAHSPGLYTVMPSNPRDAKGLRVRDTQWKACTFLRAQSSLSYGRRSEGKDLTIVSAGAA